MLGQAAGVHARMADARKAFDEETNKTFIEDLRQFLATPYSEALVLLITPSNLITISVES